MTCKVGSRRFSLQTTRKEMTEDGCHSEQKRRRKEKRARQILSAKNLCFAYRVCVACDSWILDAIKRTTIACVTLNGITPWQAFSYAYPCKREVTSDKSSSKLATITLSFHRLPLAFLLSTFLAWVL